MGREKPGPPGQRARRERVPRPPGGSLLQLLSDQGLAGTPLSPSLRRDEGHRVDGALWLPPRVERVHLPGLVCAARPFRFRLEGTPRWGAAETSPSSCEAVSPGEPRCAA